MRTDFRTGKTRRLHGLMGVGGYGAAAGTGGPIYLFTADMAVET